MNDYTPATKVVHSDHRIVIHAGEDRWIRHTDDPHRREMAKLNDILSDIKRHVDGYESAGIIYATDKVCAYCEYRWDWCIDEHGQPGCCDEAVKDWETQTGRKYE